MNEEDSERLHTFKVTHPEGLESEDKLGSDSKPMFCIFSCIMPSTVFELMDRWIEGRCMNMVIVQQD